MAEAEHVSVKFGNHHILRDVSLSIPRGQTVAIIGESGCGKTVLMKTLIGLIRPSRGRVLFDGQDLSTLSHRELATATYSIWFCISAGGPIRQSDDRPECGLSVAAAYAIASS